jgi:integrase
MNDIRINKEKIGKFLGEAQRKNTDRSYYHNEIKKILDVSDIRMKVVILLMASTGIRIGSIPELKLKNLEEIPDKQIYKITVYERSKKWEYYTFCSPECYSVIKSYLDYRKKSGELLDDESSLIREQFDINDFEQIRKKSRKISITTLKMNMQLVLRKAGITEVNHNFNYGDRNPIPMSHGFRKFWMNQAVKSKMNPEAREILLGHKIGLASAYYRHSEDEMLDAYLVAVDGLTINEEQRLRRQVETLQVEKSLVDQMRIQIEQIQAQINSYKS